MIAHIAAGLVLAAATATAASCAPTTSLGTGSAPAGSVQHASPAAHQRTPQKIAGPGQCPTDWVCGTCPNGDTWGYLNDGSPDAKTVTDRMKHPCND